MAAQIFSVSSKINREPGYEATATLAKCLLEIGLVCNYYKVATRFHHGILLPAMDILLAIESSTAHNYISIFSMAMSSLSLLP